MQCSAVRIGGATRRGRRAVASTAGTIRHRITRAVQQDGDGEAEPEPSLHSDVAAEALADDLPAARAALAHIRAASSETMRELRASVGLPRGNADGKPRFPAIGLSHLDRLVSSTSASGLPVNVRVAGEAIVLPVVVDTDFAIWPVNFGKLARSHRVPHCAGIAHQCPAAR
jgi:hypothetical protein